MAETEIVKTYITEMKALVDRKSYRDALSNMDKIKKALDKLEKSYAKGEITTRKRNSTKKELVKNLQNEAKATKQVEREQVRQVKTLGALANLEAKIARIKETSKARNAAVRSAGTARASVIGKMGEARSSVFTQGTTDRTVRIREAQAAKAEGLRANQSLREQHALRMKEIRASGRTGFSGGGGRSHIPFLGAAMGGVAGTARVFSPGLPALAAGALGAYGATRAAQASQRVYGNKMAFQMVEGSPEAGMALQNSYINRANVSGINASENTTNYLNLRTALKAQGMEGKSEDMFFGLADYGMAMGVDKERMDKAFMAFGQMAGKNQIMA
jgi:hypothetical protein